MTIIFFGSDDFALVHLERLWASEHAVVACVTPPDQPKGRGMKVISSPIKDFAVAHRIPVLQPATLKDPAFVAQLKSYAADLFIVIAYGKILPVTLLQIPSVCALNVHGSLLPRYRGAAPVNWAIINGDQETGVSIIKMNAALDAGDIVRQERMPIDPHDTAVTLRAKMARVGAESLLKAIRNFGSREYPLRIQDPQAVTLAPKLTRELGLIDWKKSAVHIHNLVRGLLPWPAAYTLCQGKTIKILETEIVSKAIVSLPPASVPGILTHVTPQGFAVATGKGLLLVKKVLPESSKPMDAKSFLAGHRIAAGYRFD